MTTLKEYKAMMEGATDAPWSISHRADTAVSSNNERGICSTGGYADNRRNPDELAKENKCNADFIAASRNIASDLIRVIELAEEKLAFISDGCLVPPDGGSPDIYDYMKAANEALSEIRKLRG